MAKKDKKQGKKDKARTDASDVVDAVRGAVERTFQATAGGAQPARDAGRGLLDEVASAAQRIRESFDDLRVLEDVRGLRAEIEALSRRVAALEQRESAARTAGRRRDHGGEAGRRKPARASPPPQAGGPQAGSPQVDRGHDRRARDAPSPPPPSPPPQAGHREAGDPQARDREARHRQAGGPQARRRAGAPPADAGS